MYDVVIRKTIWETPDHHYPGQKFARLSYQIQLPFLPFNGLNLIDGDWVSGSLSDLTWDNNLEEFTCKVIDEHPYEEDDEWISFDQIVEEHRDLGWDLSCGQL